MLLLLRPGPTKTRPEELLQTLMGIGYSVWDPRKTRSFEEEETDLVRERNRLVAASGVSAVTIALMLIELLATPAGVGSSGCSAHSRSSQFSGWPGTSA